MKKIRLNKKGFTLVECIVAMALMVVMVVMASTILAGALKIRQANIHHENEMDEQMDAIAKDSPASTANVAPKITFYKNGGVTPAAEIDPNDGTGIKVEQQYDEDASFELDALDYDYSNYEAKVIADNGGLGGGGGQLAKVSGAIDATSITVQSASETLADGVYTISWQYSFSGTYKYGDDNEKALKVAIPIGADLTKLDNASNVKGMSISDRLIRITIAPSNSSGDWTGSCSIKVTFTISEEDYNANYKSFSDYMGCASGSNSATFSKQADDSFKCG